MCLFWEIKHRLPLITHPSLRHWLHGTTPGAARVFCPQQALHRQAVAERQSLPVRSWGVLSAVHPNVHWFISVQPTSVLLILCVFLFLTDSRGGRTQDHGVYSLWEQEAQSRPQYPTLPVRPGCWPGKICVLVNLGDDVFVAQTILGWLHYTVSVVDDVGFNQPWAKLLPAQRRSPLWRKEKPEKVNFFNV